MSNIKAAVESILRQYGVIKNSEDVSKLSFALTDQVKVKDWEMMKEIPVQLVLKKEEVTVINY